MMKRYADLIGNYKNCRIKSQQGNKVDYRGEVKVAVHNDTELPQYISNGDRIAQLIIQPYLIVDFKEAEELNETVRGSGGFGSTGS